MSDSAPVLTIDGPGGSGKGAVSRAVAQQLHWNLLDSGALYRALGYLLLEEDVDRNDIEAVTKIAKTFPVVFLNDQVYIEEDNVTAEIRSERVGAVASEVGVHPPVREALLGVQQSFAKLPGLVADGRDMGTVVFPKAFCKIYLDASPAERAKRRYLQLKDSGFDVNLAELEAQIVARDNRDKTRAVAPLKPAADAVVIDTTELTINEVVTKVVGMAKERLPSE